MARIWQTMLDEPLIPFALIGAVLFVAYGFRQSAEELETIEVRPATIQALESMQEELLGRELHDEEREQLVEGYVEEEVLMREAFRMGLEKKDSRIRKRLLNVMRSTLDQPVAQPTRAELEAYFRESRERYEPSEVVTFDHVFFAFGSEKEPEDADAFLASLRGGADHSQLGDYQQFGNQVREVSLSQLAQMVGGDFARQAFALSLDQWQGPIESRQGIHFLRVTSKAKPRAPDFEKLESYLQQDWMFQKRREIQAKKIAELRKRYRVVHVKEE